MTHFDPWTYNEIERWLVKQKELMLIGQQTEDTKILIDVIFRELSTNLNYERDMSVQEHEQYAGGGSHARNTD